MSLADLALGPAATAAEAALGPGAVFTGDAAQEKAAALWTRLGRPRAVVFPASTEEVAQVLRIAHRTGAGVVAWGGKTGLVTGAFADGQIALSLDRMNR